MVPVVDIWLTILILVLVKTVGFIILAPTKAVAGLSAILVAVRSPA